MPAFVLNVIGTGADPALFGRLEPDSASILSLGHAFDLSLATENRVSRLAEARRLAAGLKLDINMVATARRRKKLLVADMDSTIINVECLDELAGAIGLKAKIAAITERA
ncbi:MAG: phosphoserine phosphatase SerB, partial [Rhizomicrobium sp.]